MKLFASVLVVLFVVSSVPAQAQNPPVVWPKSDWGKEVGEDLRRALETRRRLQGEAQAREAQARQEAERIRVEDERNRIQAERVRLEGLRPDVQPTPSWSRDGVFQPAGDPRYLEAQIQADLVELFGAELAVKIRPVLERLVKNLMAQQR